MQRALICDDEPLMRANLREQLQALWPELEIVAEAGDGRQALQALRTLQPDIAFLDIQMPGLSGLQVAQLAGPCTQVVFVTAHDQHALEAFETHAVDYLLKPLDPARLGRLVLRLQREQQRSPDRALAAIHTVLRQLAARPVPEPASVTTLEWLQVDAGRQIRMLHVDDVMYFESDNKYTRVVGDDCDGLIRLSLKELLAAIDQRFFLQVHRSVVVNRRFVHSVHRRGETMELQIHGRPERLRVSEANQPLFKAM